MKEISFILCTVVLLSCSIDNESIDINVKDLVANESPAEVRSVVFYNVENLFDIYDDPIKDDDDFTPFGYYKWDKEKYDKKLDRISDALVLPPSFPAIIGLAEVENKEVLKDLLNEPEFAGKNFGISHFQSPDRRGIDVALLYDKDVFTVEDEQALPVKMSYDSNFKTRDILHVSGVYLGEKIHVFVNHWSSRREGVSETEHRRLTAAKLLKDNVQEVFETEPEAQVLILGDFNDYPNNKSLNVVLGAQSIEYVSSCGLINPFIDLQKGGVGTSVYKREWNILDQIILSSSFFNDGPLKLKENKGNILREEVLLYTYKNGDQKPNSTYGGPNYYGGYSDHLPVFVEIGK